MRSCKVITLLSLFVLYVDAQSMSGDRYGHAHSRCHGWRVVKPEMCVAVSCVQFARWPDEVIEQHNSTRYHRPDTIIVSLGHTKANAITTLFSSSKTVTFSHSCDDRRTLHSDQDNFLLIMNFD